MNVNENNEDDNKTHYRQQQQNDTKNKDEQIMKQEGKNATPGNTQEINLDNSNDGDDNQNTNVSDDQTIDQLFFLTICHPLNASQLAKIHINFSSRCKTNASWTESLIIPVN